MRISVVVAALALGLAGPGLAGSPVEEEVVCPVGGEKFTITGTASCTSPMGVNMALRQLTSCDFITQLPVCPGNGLPMYRDFAAVEVKDLEGFITTAPNQALLDKSAYWRAYVIEGHLTSVGSSVGFWGLQNGLWWDRDALLAEPGMMDVFVREATGEAARIAADQRPFLQASVAYQLAMVGRDDEARDWLAAARAGSAGSAFLTDYLEAIMGCIGQVSREACQPDAVFQD